MPSPKTLRPQGKTFTQTVRFAAPPQAVYDLLMVSRLHAAVTGEKAKISPKVDGAISAYGGYIEGRNVLLDPGKRIVQAWRAEDWPAGWYSTATWEFKAAPGGTAMNFHHSHVPDAEAAHIKKGWVDCYWEPMAAYLARESEPKPPTPKSKKKTKA
jgi:uncharacterized protein YndB with AHSA1/START domain